MQNYFIILYDSITIIIDIRIRTYCKILISAESFQGMLLLLLRSTIVYIIEKYILEILLNFL